MARTPNPFPDLRELKHFTDETDGRALALPINGKTYTFEAGKISYRAGLLITKMRVAQLAHQAALDAGQDPDPNVDVLNNDDYTHVLTQLVPPERRDQFIADGLTIDEVEHVRKTVMIWLMWGEEAAVNYWVGELDGGDDDNPPADSASTKTAGSSVRSSTSGTNRRRSTGATSSKTGDSSKPDSSSTAGSTSPRPKSSTARHGGGSS